MTKISNFPHKDVLCLISLTTEIRQKMIKNDYNPDDAKKKLKGIGVDVCDLTIQNLSKINQYRLVIIICHHIQSQDIDALVLSDNTLLPVDVFVNAISKEFTGLLDLAICQSKEMAYAIKALSKFSDSIRIQYVEDETDVEFRLCYIYPDLLKYFSFDPIDDYKERYIEAYRKAVQYAIRRQNEEVKDPNSLPEGTKLGTMAASAVPPLAVRNSPFPVKVYIHADGEEMDICAEIEGYRRHIKRNLKLNDGDQISWNLSFNTAPEPYEDLNKHILGAGSHSETWNGNSRIDFTFDCFVRSEFRLNGFTVVLNTIIGKEELDTCKLPVEVRPYKDDQPLLEPFNLETEFKSGNSHSVSNNDRQYPIEGNQYKAGRIVEQFKPGHPIGSLFIEDDKKEKWANIFTDFLNNHASQHDFTIGANKQDYISMAFVSFYIRWLDKDGEESKGILVNNKEKDTPNGPACFRFLTIDCRINHRIKGQNPTNQYGNVIRDEIVDRINGEKSPYKKIRDKTKEVDEEVSNWFSEHGLNNKD